jgi:heat shock protein HslJ/uncharacterized lipoprotein YbaY
MTHRFLATGWFVLALALSTAAAIGFAPSAHAQTRSVTGTVSMLGRIALGPNAIVVVEARNPGFSGPIGETRIRLGGRQLPTDFTLPIRDGRVAATTIYVQASVLQAGGVRYASETRRIELSGPVTNAGDFEVRPSRAVAFMSAFLCEGREVTFGMEGDTPVLRLDGRRHVMTRQRVASGTAYVSSSRPRITLRQHQGSTTLQIGRGPAEPCRATLAHGGPMPPQQPQAVPPASRLIGGWIVQSLAGSPPQRGRPMTLSFGDNGRLAGSGSCNRYMASYTVEGASLRISPTVATMMACPPAIMEQERRFLAFLAGAARWRIDANARLTIVNAEGDELVAGAGP